MSSFGSLRHLKPGESGTIKKVIATGELGRRIRDMGLVTGATLLMMGRAPLKDPVEIKLKGYNLALRNNEADHILVEQAEL
ncbi:iron transporter FeoA [Desulfocarbo indianensis]|nr:iron transporter FeoA [Desulfocarbo indianensis]